MTASARAGGVITSLRLRIETLPLRRRGAHRVESVRLCLTLVKAAADSCAETRQVRENIQIAFPDAPMAASERWLATARTRATALLAALRVPDDIEEADVERGLADLRKAVQSAQKEVRAEWRQQIEAVSARYGRLVKALHETRVQGSGTLRAAVERVQRMDEAPSSRNAALRASEDIGAVVTAIRDLGLEGPVGEFLTAAADKRASAQLLRHAEVVAFLDKHDLWEVLVVALR